jgi:hypothetical protein
MNFVSYPLNTLCVKIRRGQENFSRLAKAFVPAGPAFLDGRRRHAYVTTNQTKVQLFVADLCVRPEGAHAGAPLVQTMVAF